MANNLLQVTDAQIDKIYRLLDQLLKKEGLDALQEVVEIYNALMTAVKMPEAPLGHGPQEPAPVEDVKPNE